jgi:hypothetical protein
LGAEEATTEENTETRVVVACRIFGPELEMLNRRAGGPAEIRYLDQSLHRTPKLMPDLVQAQIDEAAGYASQIVLGYGLCSNGIAGVTAPPQGLIVPRVHDCIALFLGSRASYERAFRDRPGTYYLTAGWVSENRVPLGILENEYVPRVGREKAEWALGEELKHYTHIALIDTGVEDLGPLRGRAMENARFLDKQYEEIQGLLGYFEKILCGPYLDGDFFLLKPGETITQDLFLVSAGPSRGLLFSP